MARRTDPGCGTSRQNGVRSREDVIAAAGKTFFARGYHGTSMRDLARELGLIGSSLYSHIESKADLLVEVVERGANLFQESADKAMATTGRWTDPAAGLVAGHVDVVLDHPDEVRTFFTKPTPSIRVTATESWRLAIAMSRRFEPYCGRGRGRFVAIPTSIPDWPQSSFSRSSTPSKGGTRPNGRLSRDELVREILAFGLEGIGP